MDQESGSAPTSWVVRLKAELLLAYQSFGIVYGDLITSPIYVYQSTFGGSVHLRVDDDEIFGVFSLIFWTLTLIPLGKYIIFVLRADDNGEGGTFALYSLLCRRAKLGLLSTSQLPNNNPVPENASPPRDETAQTRTEVFLRNLFDNRRSSRISLLLAALLGTSMVIGDGILTPAMSVLSAVSGIRIKVTDLHENYTVLIACIILVGLFALQRFGTHRVGFLFAPILLAWLFCIIGVGIYNVVHWNPNVFMALSPHYAYKFFKKTGKDGWRSLGGVFLCVTGAEAMFADLGHFSKTSIRMAFSAIVYPCLIVAYLGEAAYLSKNKENIQRSFYKSIPEPVFWPVFVISTLATIVASQAIISGTFSIISQCRALKCFPAIKIKYTSDDRHGQIYIPEVNWSLMIMCLAVVIGFRDTRMIGNAYGLAVVIVMFVTTCLMFFVIVMVWRRHVVFALGFVAVFGSVELVYFSSCLMKVPKGGWLPLILSAIVLAVMCTWHYVTLKKQAYEAENGLTVDTLLALGLNRNNNRVPGICLVYTSVPTDVPQVFTHFVTHFPAFHHFIVFVTFQALPVPRVPYDEQIHIGRIEPSGAGLFRCIVRYGYKDSTKDGHAFEVRLVEELDEFIIENSLFGPAGYLGGSSSSSSSGDQEIAEYAPGQDEPESSSAAGKKVRFRCVVGKGKRGRDGSDSVEMGEIESVEARGEGERRSSGSSSRLRFGSVIREPHRNLELLDYREATETAGVAYMMANTRVVANETSSLVKRFVVDVVYGFLRQNCRRPATSFGVPHKYLVEVGMVYSL